MNDYVDYLTGRFAAGENTFLTKKGYATVQKLNQELAEREAKFRVARRIIRSFIAVGALAGVATGLFPIWGAMMGAAVLLFFTVVVEASPEERDRALARGTHSFSYYDYEYEERVNNTHVENLLKQILSYVPYGSAKALEIQQNADTIRNAGARNRAISFAEGRSADLDAHYQNLLDNLKGALEKAKEQAAPAIEAEKAEKEIERQHAAAIREIEGEHQNAVRGILADDSNAVLDEISALIRS